MSLLTNKTNNNRMKLMDNLIGNENNNGYNKIYSNKSNNTEKDKEYELEEEEEGEEESNNEEEYYEEYIGDENEEEEEDDDDDDDNLSILESYKYKLNYSDNIRLYPRPKQIIYYIKIQIIVIHIYQIRIIKKKFLR